MRAIRIVDDLIPLCAYPGTQIVKRDLLVIRGIPSLDKDCFLCAGRQKEVVTGDEIRVFDITGVGRERKEEEKKKSQVSHRHLTTKPTKLYTMSG